MKRFFRILWVLLVGGGILGGVFYLRPLWVADQMLRLHLWREGVRSEYVVAGGYRLHYFEAGSSGPAVVLIHGLGSRGEDWAPMLTRMAADGFHVYAPDLLGYGRSPQPDVDYAIGLQEKVVSDFLDVLRLGRVDVGGWSMGGWVAMRLAADHPERVGRLLLYDSAGTYFAPQPGVELFVPADEAGLERLMAAISPKPKVFPGFVAKDAVRKLQRNGWVVSRSMAAMRSGRDLMDFRLGEIRQPTLVVWGGRDDLIPPAVGETIHRGIAGSSMVVAEGCGHLAPLECPAAVEKATVEFLRAH